MNNHVHFVVKADPSSLAKAIKSLNIKYAMRFNQQRERIGHVFQDRYKSEDIEDDKYLMQVIRYVHINPVKAKLVKSPEEYQWSSYNEYINGSRGAKSVYISDEGIKVAKELLDKYGIKEN